MDVIPHGIETKFLILERTLWLKVLLHNLISDKKSEIQVNLKLKEMEDFVQAIWLIGDIIFPRKQNKVHVYSVSKIILPMKNNIWNI